MLRRTLHLTSSYSLYMLIQLIQLRLNLGCSDHGCEQLKQSIAQLSTWGSAFPSGTCNKCNKFSSHREHIVLVIARIPWVCLENWLQIWLFFDVPICFEMPKEVHHLSGPFIFSQWSPRPRCIFPAPAQSGWTQTARVLCAASQAITVSQSIERPNGPKQSKG